MNAVIDSNISLVNVDLMLRRKLEEKLKVRNPNYFEAIRKKRPPDGPPYFYQFENIGDKLIIPRGCMDDVYPHLDNAIITDNRCLFEFQPIESKIVLQPLQEKALLTLLDREEGFLKAPAGSGKTIMGLELVSRLGQPTLWITHLDRLFKQVIERIRFFLPTVEIGEIRGDKIEISNQITVAMVPSLIRKERNFSDRFGLVIIDEAHHIPASTFLVLAREFSAYYIYGLTATDYRNDGLDQIMFNAIGPVRATISYESLVNEGKIIKPELKLIKTGFSADLGLRPRNIYRKCLNILMKSSKRNTLIANMVIADASKGCLCIVISNRRKHCRLLYDYIVPNWSRTAIAIGDIKKKEVDESLAAMNTGEITVLITTFEMLGEGFDLPRLDRLFFTVPFKAKTRVEQGIGRLQRAAEGKEKAIVYEFLDNISYCNHLFDFRAEVYEKLGLEVTK